MKQQQTINRLSASQLVSAADVGEQLHTVIFSYT